MFNQYLRQYILNPAYPLLFIAGLLLLVQMYFSLDWYIEGDTPVFYYYAYLIDKFNFIPYKDIFMSCMPGTFFTYYFLGKLFGYTAFSINIANVIYAFCIGFFTFQVVKKISMFSAVISVMGFYLYYFGCGSIETLQKDYLAILPIIAALYCATTHISMIKKMAMIGVLFSYAFSIKPTLGIGYPIVLLYALYSHTSIKQYSVSLLTKYCCLSFLSFCIIPALTVVYLFQNDALSAFIEIYKNYMPLYLQISTYAGLIQPSDHLYYLLVLTVAGFTAYGGYLYYFGIYSCLNLSNHKHKKLCWTVVALTLAYALHVTISGKFWHYYWFPFIFFAFIVKSFVFEDIVMQGKQNTKKRIFLIFLLFIFLRELFIPHLNVFQGVQSLSFAEHIYPGFHLQKEPKDRGRSKEIAHFLQEQKLTENDTVQVLDYIYGGALHGLLLSGAKHATKFTQDYWFYHHSAHPYIQKMRKDFMTELKTSSPRFIVDIDWKIKIGVSNEPKVFPELDQLKKTSYHVAYKGQGFTILEKNDG